MIKLQLTKRKKPHVKTIPTKYLKQIIANEGYNEQHTKDYGPVLDEVVNELNRRYLKADTIEQAKLSSMLNDPQYKLITEGKTCTICNLLSDYDSIAEHFYLKRGRYRSECKQCSKDKVKRTRQLAKIKLDEIPF